MVSLLFDPSSDPNAFVSQASPYLNASNNANRTAVQPQHARSVKTNPISNPLSNVTKLGDIGRFGSGVNNAINTVGSKIGFGPGIGAPLKGGVGPTNFAQAGSLGTKATFGSVLGGAGVGGMIGSWLGGGTAQSQIGGAIGGALGAMSGISSGIALGSTLGSVVPGLGTILGGVAGSLLGGMFGGKKPHPESGYTGSTIDPTGKITGGMLGAKHVDKSLGDSMYKDFQQYLTDQTNKYGVKYKTPMQMDIVYSPTRWDSGDSRIMITNKDTGAVQGWDYNLDDADSKNTAYENAWKHMLTNSGIDFGTLKPINPTTMQELVINKPTGPSDWDTFINEYRKNNAQLA